MSAPAFTKGKWSVSEHISGDPYFYVMSNNGVCLAQIHRRENADLIAAAPDLYAALIETLEIAARNEDGDWAIRARAALAKASPKPPVSAS